MNEEELRRVLEKLRTDYVAQLPGTVAEMEDLWRRILAAEVPLAQLEKLERMAHSIAGSGTTFGLPEASRAARELEFFLDRFADGGQLPGAEDQQRISALLAALGQTAARQE